MRRLHTISTYSAPPDAIGAAAVASEELPAPIKFESVLHMKLAENNAEINNSVKDFWNKSIQKAQRTFDDVRKQFDKTKDTVRSISDTMRHITNDEFKIEDKLDAITNGDHLPDLNIG